MLIEEYKGYLTLEQGLSGNSRDAYEHDVTMLLDYLDTVGIDCRSVDLATLSNFVMELGKMGLSARSQARIVSGVRSFYRFMLYSEKMEYDPAERLMVPKAGRHLPEVLTLDEIESMIATLEENTVGSIEMIVRRNRAIIEVMYGSGLRVSELVNLQFSDIRREEEFMIIRGKGDKQRMVPISEIALTKIDEYAKIRGEFGIKRGEEDIVFLNQRGARLTRTMILIMVKDLAKRTGIKKTISPHTFRHSFATSMLEGGANLRVIQMLLGHESIETTEIYTHIDNQRLREEILNFHPRNQK